MTAVNGADVLMGRALADGLAARPAIIAGDRVYSYAGLAQEVARAAGALRALGVGVGERVLMVVDDRPEFFFVYLGAMKIGAVPVALSLRLSASELRFVIEDSAATVIVADPMFAGLCRAAMAGLDPAPRLIISDISAEPGDGGPIGGLDDLGALMQGQPPELASVELSRDDMAFWMYTSGTTGTPKGAVHAIRSLESCESYLQQVYGAKAGDKLFCSSKLFFAFSIGHALMGALRLGCTAILHSGWPSPEAVADVVERHRPDMVFSVPTLYRALLQAGVADTPAFRAVRRFIAAGERLPETVFEQWLAATGRPILEGIGATEALVMFIGNRPDDYTPGATGKPFPGVEVRLTTDQDEPMTEIGSPGVLWVRAPTLAAGYFGQPEKTAAVLRDGWYRTGDVFTVDAKGVYRHQGRSDDMLKISGQWVSPAEIEEHVLRHPRVSNAAVIGIANEAGLVRLTLCLEPIDLSVDRDALQAELTEKLTAELSIYKCPRRFVYLDEMPMTATGKVQRFRLREIVQQAGSEP